MAELTFSALYRYRDDLFDLFDLPHPPTAAEMGVEQTQIATLWTIDKDDFIARLCFETMSFSVAFPDADFLKAMLGAFSRTELPRWQRHSIPFSTSIIRCIIRMPSTQEPPADGKTEVSRQTALITQLMPPRMTAQSAQMEPITFMVTMTTQFQHQTPQTRKEHSDGLTLTETSLHRIQTPRHSLRIPLQREYREPIPAQKAEQMTGRRKAILA